MCYKEEYLKNCVSVAHSNIDFYIRERNFIMAHVWEKELDKLVEKRNSIS